MDMVAEHLAPEPVKGPINPQAQPVAALANLDAELDDAAVRQAIANLEASNKDPMTATLADLSVNPPPAPVAELPKLEVPEKFKKPDGEVDVEKLQTSTRQLDEALKVKQAAVQKTVDDYLREYNKLETEFRNTPNPDRLAASLPVNPPAPVPQQAPIQMSDQQLREIIARDYQADPVATTAQLIEIAISKRLEPYEKERKDMGVRGNLEQLASKDPRVLEPQVFAAINAKLAEEPSMWRLKNPHKAAWLEVKEELHLGEPSQAQAQPSRPLSPVLGGGTPPSAPSSLSQAPQNVIGNLDRLDLKDRRQEALGDEAIRALLARSR